METLFSTRPRTQLLARPQGPTTEDGMRYAMYMATEYMYQQLHGNNAAAIDDPNTGLRFMNDLATYEIFWHFLYLTVYHGVELTDDGKISKKGDRVTPELFVKLLDERRDTVKELFKKLGTSPTRDTTPSSCCRSCKRQIVETGPDGTARAADALDQVRLASPAVGHRAARSGPGGDCRRDFRQSRGCRRAARPRHGPADAGPARKSTRRVRLRLRRAARGGSGRVASFGTAY